MQNFKSYQEYLDNWCILITRFGFSQLCLVAVDATGTLQQDFGVVGTALNWFDSFLSGRKQRILVGDKTSDDFNLNCGVPQGSCMGPILFTLYVSRLFNIISQHLPSIHGYADDTQLYLSFRPCFIHSEINAVSMIEKCIADVRC